MFRKVLKFEDVTSLDFSPYEGATVIQDIGASLREGLAGQFDLAVDGGTLEHVFNFPVAIANLMRDGVSPEKLFPLRRTSAPAPVASVPSRSVAGADPR